MREISKMGKDMFFYTQNISIGYKNKKLIDDINIGIHRGEILTLIGPNGSGKSTFLKSIIKELKPIKGAIYIDGKDIYEYSSKEYAQKLAVVLTGKPTTQMMSCREFVSMGRYPYTNFVGHMMDSDIEIADEAIKRVHAEDIAEADFMNISDGQRQRIILARAICQQPEIIILDEPTSFLDIRHKIELLNILREMAAEKNVTVIMSLHEIDLAYKISDYIMCIDESHKVYCGTPDEIFKEDNIKNLYRLNKGTYNVMYGSVELNSPCGKAIVAVIGGAGYGIPVYRELQRLDIPFAAGVIFENDIDYPVAHVLAEKVIKEQPFSEISEESYEKMRHIIDEVEYVIDCECPVHSQNIRNKELIEYAREKGKIILERPGRNELKSIMKI